MRTIVLEYKKPTKLPGFVGIIPGWTDRNSYFWNYLETWVAIPWGGSYIIPWGD